MKYFPNKSIIVSLWRTIFVLIVVLFTGIAIGLFSARLETNSLEYSIGGITDTYNYPEISIDNKGNLFHAGRQIDKIELAEIIMIETQKMPQSFEDVSLMHEGVLPMYGTIMLHVHDDLPFKHYLEISEFISIHGGNVATFSGVSVSNLNNTLNE